MDNSGTGIDRADTNRGTNNSGKGIGIEISDTNNTDGGVNNLSKDKDIADVDVTKGLKSGIGTEQIYTKMQIKEQIQA